jgi:hypothetical protein
VHELCIHRGEPTAEELAALVTVLLGGRRGPAAAPGHVPLSRWRLSARPRTRTDWRGSALPLR